MALTETVKLRISLETREAVEALAKREDRSASQIMRRAIRAYVEAQQPDMEKVA